MTSSTRALVAGVSRLVKLMTMRPPESVLIVAEDQTAGLEVGAVDREVRPATRAEDVLRVARRVAVHAERGARIVAIAAILGVEVDVGDVAPVRIARSVCSVTAAGPTHVITG
jgi:hypothetical protein